jgi:trehalose/maltose hydrolase-like predicted phosphorylase
LKLIKKGKYYDFKCKKFFIDDFSESGYVWTKSDEWHLSANSRENYYGVAMANGQIGIVTDDTPLKTKEIILNGVYEASPENGISRIVRGIEFLNLHLSINNQQIESNNIDNWNQVVSMKEGTSTTSFTFKDLVSVDYTILANRAIPYSAMAIVEITPKKDMEIIANNYMVVPDQLIEAKSQFRVLKTIHDARFGTTKHYLGNIPLRLQRPFI